MKKNILLISILLSLLSIGLILSQLWKYEHNNTYLIKDYNNFDFIYDYNQKKPLGVLYQEDVESIYFLKDKQYSHYFINDYNHKYLEYQWKYKNYNCNIEIMKNTSLFTYGKKSIYVAIETDDFWILREIDCYDIKNSSDFQNSQKINELTLSFIEEMIKLYESSHNQIKEIYQMGQEELLNEEMVMIGGRHYEIYEQS